MKVLTEERLRKFIRATNMDHEHNVLAGQLIEALEDVEFITKEELESMLPWPELDQDGAEGLYRAIAACK